MIRPCSIMAMRLTTITNLYTIFLASRDSRFDPWHGQISFYFFFFFSSSASNNHQRFPFFYLTHCFFAWNILEWKEKNCFYYFLRNPERHRCFYANAQLARPTKSDVRQRAETCLLPHCLRLVWPRTGSIALCCLRERKRQLVPFLVFCFGAKVVKSSAGCHYAGFPSSSSSNSWQTNPYRLR